METYRLVRSSDREPDFDSHHEAVVLARSIRRHEKRVTRDRVWQGRAKRNNARARQAERNLGLPRGSLGTCSAEELRELVTKFESRCAHCGRHLDFNGTYEQGDPAMPTFDHLIELGRGGPGTKENLVPSCLGCNNGREHLRQKRRDRFPPDAAMVRGEKKPRETRFPLPEKAAEVLARHPAAKVYSELVSVSREGDLRPRYERRFYVKVDELTRIYMNRATYEQDELHRVYADENGNPEGRIDSSS